MSTIIDRVRDSIMEFFDGQPKRPGSHMSLQARRSDLPAPCLACPHESSCTACPHFQMAFVAPDVDPDEQLLAGAHPSDILPPVNQQSTINMPGKDSPCIPTTKSTTSLPTTPSSSLERDVAIHGLDLVLAEAADRRLKSQAMDDINDGGPSDPAQFSSSHEA